MPMHVPKDYPAVVHEARDLDALFRALQRPEVLRLLKWGPRVEAPEGLLVSWAGCPLFAPEEPEPLTPDGWTPWPWDADRFLWGTPVEMHDRHDA